MIHQFKIFCLQFPYHRMNFPLWPLSVTHYPCTQKSYCITLVFPILAQEHFGFLQYPIRGSATLVGRKLGSHSTASLQMFSGWWRNNLVIQWNSLLKMSSTMNTTKKIQWMQVKHDYKAKWLKKQLKETFSIEKAEN
jgi:hypothetical protein